MEFLVEFEVPAARLTQRWRNASAHVLAPERGCQASRSAWNGRAAGHDGFIRQFIQVSDAVAPIVRVRVR
jgi:hypothetical protein